MLEFIRNGIIQELDGIILILSCLLVSTLAILIVYWQYNRRKFRKLTHQIPATIVKNYLDSIIQNSAALKSSLFRGGGSQNAPSVVPSTDLPKGNVPASNMAGGKELGQKNAEIAN